MPPRIHPDRPTPAELEVLQVLWRKGACTVREVFEELGQGRELGYTTILKLMQTMHSKGMLVRDDSSRTHTYAARRSREDTRGAMTQEFLERVFQGSTEQMMLSALGMKEGDAEQLKKLRALLAEAKAKRGRR